MKKIFIPILCTALFFCGCADNQGTAEISPTESLPDVTAIPTPTLPSDKGPSAVFTATPDPNATPMPTSTAIPLPTGLYGKVCGVNGTETTVDDAYYGVYTFTASSVGGWEFKYDSDYFETDVTGESKVELLSKLQVPIKTKFKALTESLDSVDTVYLNIRSYGTNNIYIPTTGRTDDFFTVDFYVALKGKTLEK